MPCIYKLYIIIDIIKIDTNVIVVAIIVVFLLLLLLVVVVVVIVVGVLFISSSKTYAHCIPNVHKDDCKESYGNLR